MARTRALEIVRNRSVAFFALDGRGTFRYTARLRPGGGTADASVSKTDIERCVGSNPTPGTTSSPAIARQLIHPTTADVIFHIRVFATGRPVRPDAPGTHAATASSRAEMAIRRERRPRTMHASITHERQPQAVRAETKKLPPRVQTREREPLRTVSATSVYSANSFSPLNTARASATE